MILTGVFLALFAGWMLLFWMAGDAWNVRWLRNWCAGIFVTIAIFLCLGGGVWMTRKYFQSEHRRQVQEFADLMIERVHAGRTQDVEDALRHLAGQTEEWTAEGDVLSRLSQVTEALKKTTQPKVAERSRSEQPQTIR